MSESEAGALERATLLFVEGFFQRELAKVMESVPLHTTKEQILLEAMARALMEQMFARYDIVSLWKMGRMNKQHYSPLCQQALQLLAARREGQNVHLGSD